VNGIEIPAAILQPPFYDPKADAGVNYCTLGAVIGHELTHSLDSTGRLFDASGALRDWWAPADVAAFDKRSKNLIRQGNAYEVLPGVHLNGQLSSGENLADIGGIMLGYRALQTHLKANPQDRPQDRRVHAADSAASSPGRSCGQRRSSRSCCAFGLRRSRIHRAPTGWSRQRATTLASTTPSASVRVTGCGSLRRIVCRCGDEGIESHPESWTIDGRYSGLSNCWVKRAATPAVAVDRE
jgi:hypothetical protein